MTMEAKKLACFNTFCESIRKMGGEVLITFKDYRNNKTKIPCICKKGHKVFILAAHIYNGQGMCRACANRCPEEGERKFMERAEELGITLIDEYIDTSTKINCLCKKNHVWLLCPRYITQGDRTGVCPLCAIQSKQKSEQRFIQIIEESGGQVLGKYVKQKQEVKCLCSIGHIFYIKPRVFENKNRHFICNICDRGVPIIQELNFRNSVKELKGKIIGHFVYFSDGIECICEKGHKCYPAPIKIASGGGICGMCKLSFGERMI